MERVSVAAFVFFVLSRHSQFFFSLDHTTERDIALALGKARKRARTVVFDFLPILYGITVRSLHFNNVTFVTLFVVGIGSQKMPFPAASPCLFDGLTKLKRVVLLTSHGAIDSILYAVQYSGSARHPLDSRRPRTSTYSVTEFPCPLAELYINTHSIIARVEAVRIP